jgi:hypothetical protein
LCQGFKARGAVEQLFGAVEPTVPITLKLEAVDLSAFDFETRMFDRLELIDCKLADCRFESAMIRELVLAGKSSATLGGSHFVPGSPEVLQLDYGPRAFDPVSIQRALRRRGALGLELPADVEVKEIASWREEAQALLASRLRRFQTAEVANTPLWDTSISEKNLLGGLGTTDRMVASQTLIPEMVRQGLVTRHREHNTVVYRLTSDGKSDGFALIARNVAQGRVSDVLDALAPEPVSPDGG